ncbi:MAG: alpha/beta hydrolase fold domain-containing protein [Pseudomonadota bacterium]
MPRSALFERIEDWTAAYDNRAAVAGFEAYLKAWQRSAEAAADALGARLSVHAYGPHARQRFFLARPAEDAPRGLAVFVHGGYWRTLEPESFLHLALGPLARGFAVALPGYRLAPEVAIPEIARDVATALTAAAAAVADGPILLAGHSAGGHLVARQACSAFPLPAEVAARLAHAVTISGLHDLRPLLGAAVNEDLRLDLATAAAESPALLRPRADLPITVWVGAEELLAFRRQALLLATAWHGLGAPMALVEDAGRHHFGILDTLAEPEGALTAALFAPLDGG